MTVLPQLSYLGFRTNLDGNEESSMRLEVPEAIFEPLYVAAGGTFTFLYQHLPLAGPLPADLPGQLCHLITKCNRHGKCTPLLSMATASTFMCGLYVVCVLLCWTISYLEPLSSAASCQGARRASRMLLRQIHIHTPIHERLLLQYVFCHCEQASSAAGRHGCRLLTMMGDRGRVLDLRALWSGCRDRGGCEAMTEQIRSAIVVEHHKQLDDMTVLPLNERLVFIF